MLDEPRQWQAHRQHDGHVPTKQHPRHTCGRIPLGQGRTHPWRQGQRQDRAAKLHSDKRRPRRLCRDRMSKMSQCTPSSPHRQQCVAQRCFQAKRPRQRHCGSVADAQQPGSQEQRAACPNRHAVHRQEPPSMPLVRSWHQCCGQQRRQEHAQQRRDDPPGRPRGNSRGMRRAPEHEQRQQAYAQHRHVHVECTLCHPVMVACGDRVAKHRAPWWLRCASGVTGRLWCLGRPPHDASLDGAGPW